MHATIAVRGISKFLALALALLLASCGGGGGGGDSGAGGGGPAPTFTLSGTVSGLAGSGLVLRNNGGDNLPVAANGNFTFATAVASGAAYSVTVMTQPTGLSQICTVTNGSGTMPGANVTNIAVACTTNTFTIGGTVTGHNGSGLTLLMNGTTNLNLNLNGPFQFPALPDGSAYNVLLTNSGNQACAVSNGSGALAGANVTNIVVTCVNNGYLIGGTVNGLSGSGLVLQINGGSNTPITTSGPFVLGLPLADGSLYAVTVSSQPTNPSQTCTVTNGGGFVMGAHVTNVAVNCVTNTYKISGLVSGLAGTGLVLRNNGGNDLAIPGNGTFEFTTQIASGAAYNVSVATQPASLSQTCTVTNGSGFVASANITNVAVSCVTNTYTISGIVSGLAGTGLVLQNNSTNNLAISANGTFSFTTPIASGGTYNVTPFTQPTSPSQTCTVANGSGFVTNTNIINVAVNCTTNTYTIGGTITGLTGTGLVLRNNGGNDLTVLAGATTFAFSTPIASGAAYAVSVLTQPTNPSQGCVVTFGGTGTVGGANVTSVAIDCATNSYTIGGTITGLTGTGLVLRNNGASDLTVAANATSFTFGTTIASGQPYAVSVFTQPSSPTQTCTVTGGGSGTVAGAHVTTVAIACTTNTYTIGGTITGLTGTGLVLRNNGGDNLAVAANATSFTFSTPIASGASWAVSVLTQPSNPTQGCVVTSGGTGTVGGANVINVAIDCATSFFTIGGTISGLTGTGLVLRNNGGNDLTVAANATSFTFSTSILSGAAYAVTVPTQPTNPTQTCTVTGGGTGTVGGVNVTTVAIACTTTTYTIGGTITGLTGTGLVLRNNGGDNLTVAANATSFTFSTPVASGAAYAVSVFTQPSNPTQGCVVTNFGTGTVGGANVINVAIDCATSFFTVGGTITGLTGTGLVLRNNGGNDLTVAANATSFTFTPAQLSGTAYAVTVFAHPSTPTQTCTVTGGGTGTVGGVNVTTVAIACTTTTYTIGGTITGLTGTGLVLQNNATNNLTVLANATSFVFSTAIASGQPYAVTVLTSPSNPTQTCAVAGGGSGTGSGTVVNAAVTNVTITCTTNSYTVGGSITGLTTTGLVLRNNGANDLSVPANATSFAFPAQLSGTAYAVTPFTQPSGQLCVITNGLGTVTNANVTSVAIACSVRPVAPTLSGFYVKRLTFTWPVVSGATYKFFEDPDGLLGPTGYTQVGGTLAAPSITHTIPVHKRLNASYVYQVCNAAGTVCGPDSDALILGTSLTNAIGYVKASNPGQTDIFGVSIALSSDGNTLAVGAYLEDNATGGINGNEVDDCDAVTPVNCAPNSGAVYVFTRNTTTGVWTQQAYVKAPNPGGGVLDPVSPEIVLVEGHQFGRAVALSGDGNTLAVGARYEDSAATGIGGNQVSDCGFAAPPVPPAPPLLNCAANSGAVYVFTRTGTTWSQQAYIKASNTGGGVFDPFDPVLFPDGTNTYLEGDQFGLSVALNSDGSTLAVGAPTEDSSADGVGGNEANDSANDAGAVYVFTRSGVTWTQQAYIKASNSDAGDQFGYSVALSGASGAGTTLAVGARLEEGSTTGVNSSPNNLASSAGAAYVFTRNGAGAWSQQAYVKASNTEIGDEFGTSVALSTDGNTLAVGAPFEDSDGTSQGNNSAFNSGAVYVYTRSGTTWTHQAYIKASNPGGGVDDTDEGDEFGLSVALSGDGNTLAVGAPLEDSNATGIGGNQADNSNENAGAVYVFTRSGTTWSQQAYVKVTPGFDETFTAFDSFGASVALNSDGNTLAAGADHQEGGGQGINPTRDIDSSLAGAVYLY